jgi:hypothetical protein
MTSPPTGVERRMGQRFTFNLPVALRDVATAAEGLGFTQDLSSRGAFLFTDMPLCLGGEIELTLKMPSEITLGESMNVRCRGRVLRVVEPPESAEKNAERRIGVAVCIQGYEHLAEAEDKSAAFRRISALHGDNEIDRPQTSLPLSSRALAN